MIIFNIIMVKYDLSHLTQEDNQIVVGPIQDDEALFLYSLIRVKRIKCVLEIGGLNGYSSINFIKAMEFDKKKYKLFTCDINEVPKININHFIIKKDVKELNVKDIFNSKIELLFLDCHTLTQYDIFRKFLVKGNIDENTIIALHDTNLHYQTIWNKNGEENHVHQPVERKIVNLLKNKGYDIFCLHTNKNKHSKEFPFRHGITICQIFKKLV